MTLKIKRKKLPCHESESFFPQVLESTENQLEKLLYSEITTQSKNYHSLFDSAEAKMIINEFNENDSLTVNVNNHLIISFAQNTGDRKELTLFS